MFRIRVSICLAGALALAACTADQPHPISPIGVSEARSPSAAASRQFLVLAKSNGFAADFVSRVVALGGTVEQLHAGAGIALVSGLSQAAATQVGRFASVSDVQADQEFSLAAPLAAAQADASEVTGSSVLNPATAILYSYQWNMRLIRANAAWAAGKLGDPGVTVAILDSGMDYNNLDLNGLVDLSRSKSFVPSDDSLVTAFFPTRDKITDLNGHGTNVAQQVSSKAVVFAGVTSKTTLIGVKVLGRSGGGTISGVLQGVLWAADHGADVANMSLGYDFAKAGQGSLIGFTNRVFNYAASKGMLIVVSAGNEAEDLDHNGNVAKAYCDEPQVVCVSAVGPPTATSNPNTPAYYTNFGRSAISVAAPGGNADAANGFTVSNWPWGPDIASWVWSLCSRTMISGFSGSTPLTPCISGNRITGMIGTSQASPHVSGLAALLVAEQGRGRPSQIKASIFKSAVDLAQPGTDPYYGRGRIDVANALGL
jgi:subtilisin family serine protease